MDAYDAQIDAQANGHCARCGTAVGAYERAVWATDDGRVVIASPAGVDPRELRPSVAAHLHLDCWDEMINGSRKGAGA
jgi:hypothetical protein